MAEDIVPFQIAATDEELEDLERRLDGPEEVRVRRLPSPGIAAVLAFFWPGLGHLYAGRLTASLGWFVGTAVAYWLFFVPGFVVHAFCIWSAYRAAEDCEG